MNSEFLIINHSTVDTSVIYLLCCAQRQRMHNDAKMVHFVYRHWDFAKSHFYFLRSHFHVKKSILDMKLFYTFKWRRFDARRFDERKRPIWYLIGELLILHSESHTASRFEVPFYFAWSLYLRNDWIKPKLNIFPYLANKYEKIFSHYGKCEILRIRPGVWSEVHSSLFTKKSKFSCAR